MPAMTTKRGQLYRATLARIDEDNNVTGHVAQWILAADAIGALAQALEMSARTEMIVVAFDLVTRDAVSVVP